MSEITRNVSLVFLGVLIKHLWERFTNRTTYLQYTVTHQTLGTSVSDKLFGNVQVLHNDVQVENLYFTNIVVENFSSRDIENLTLNIFGDASTSILISYGGVDGSPNHLHFTETYAALSQKTDAQSMIVSLGRRDYLAPVMNRDSKISIQLLSTKPHGVPQVYVSTDHAGLKMKQVSALPVFMGESQKYCAILGSIMALVLCYPIYMYIPNSFDWIKPLSAALLGIFALILGCTVLKTFKIISRVIG
jgi:hypothetical protein